MRVTQAGHDGFSLVELMMVVGLLAIVLGLAIPSIAVGERVRVNNAASEVRQALQTARLRAVAVNRPMQVLFNCPAANQFRVVEGGWPEADRCSPVTYPYPARADAAYRVPSLPRYDGPPQYVPTQIALSEADPNLVLQFGPDGRVSRLVNGAAQVIVSVPVTVSSNGYTKTINVNNVGRVVTE